MKKASTLIALVLSLLIQSAGQNRQDYPKIDLLLLQGNYQQVIDTCELIIKHDTLNAGIYYKMGIAFQNLLKDENALQCFQKAATLCPFDKLYSFSLAKALYNDGTFRSAEPLLSTLCEQDSMNWAYAYYLTGIYMQSERFEEAIHVYNRFLQNDSANYRYLDKTAFACLKKGDFATAIDLYGKSLALNGRNLTAIKNLSYLYASTMRPDTAIQLLTEGIRIDSTDLDLYERRAQLNYSKNYTKRAMDDYLVLLAAGDSSTLFLKRTGIGYCNNFQPKEAITYLLIAYQTDSADFETCNYLGQSYYKLKDYPNSIYYFNRSIKRLSGVSSQLENTYKLVADSQKENGDYKGAISNYQKAYNIKNDPNMNIVIANIYDDKLQDSENAILYYKRYLDTYKNSRIILPPEYLDRVRERLEYLKKNKSRPK